MLSDAQSMFARPGTTALSMAQEPGSLSVFDKNDPLQQKVVNQSLPNLPLHFDVKASEKRFQKESSCQLCDQKYGMWSREHHCRRCCRSICSTCGSTFRNLSRSDPKPYRVCDRCDFKIVNFGIEVTYKQILKGQDKLLEKEEREMNRIREETKETEVHEIEERRKNEEN